MKTARYSRDRRTWRALGKCIGIVDHAGTTLPIVSRQKRAFDCYFRFINDKLNQVGYQDQPVART